jgi:surfactin synthase thioesterase subunit
MLSLVWWSVNQVMRMPPACLLYIQGSALARRRLVCVPFAGGSAGVYGSWKGRFPADMEVLAVELPGRASRLFEPPLTEMPAVTRHIAEGLAALSPLPLDLYGHSFGALVALEVARRLGRESPRSLVVSGCPPPHCLRPGDALMAEVERLAAQSLPAADCDRNARMRALLVRPLRADLRAITAWARPSVEPIAVPILALAGTDDPLAPPREVAHWRSLAGDTFELHAVAGEHFFPYRTERTFHHLLRRWLYRRTR